MTRHASLAAQLGDLKKYIFRPEAAEPVHSNWSTIPANDNRPPRDFSMEQRHEVRPSIQKIMASVESGKVVRNYEGVIIKIGDLKFSDGNQMEPALILGLDGKVVEGEVRLPKGAMLNDRHLQGRAYGKKNSAEISNARLCEILGVQHVPYRKGGAMRSSKGATGKEPQVLRDEAIANTPAMPAVKRYPPGLATGAEHASEQFLGMKQAYASSQNGGAIHWQDLASMAAERDMWLEIERALSDRVKMVTGILDKSQNMAQVGGSVGYGDEYARKKGRALLLEANDNISRLRRELS